MQKLRSVDSNRLPIAMEYLRGLGFQPDLDERKMLILPCGLTSYEAYPTCPTILKLSLGKIVSHVERLWPGHCWAVIHEVTDML